MGTHAFVVMAHTDPQMCHRLVSRLADHGQVHVNVNALVDPTPFAASLALSRPLEPAARVRWGAWSLVEAALRLAAQALRDPSVEQVTWLSGQHYPLRHPAEIVAAPPVDRIRLWKAPDASVGKPEWRFRTRALGSLGPESRVGQLTSATLRRVAPLRYERALGPHQLYAGTAWWSLTRETLSEMLAWIDREDAVRRYFAKLVISDESVFHTAIGAVLTERAERAGVQGVDPRELTQGATTFVRWASNAHPEPLDAESIRAAAREGWWFARKFDSTRTDLVAAAEEGWSSPFEPLGAEEWTGGQFVRPAEPRPGTK